MTVQITAAAATTKSLQSCPPNSFHEATITLVPKPDKDTKKKKITV